MINICLVVLSCLLRRHPLLSLRSLLSLFFSSIDNRLIFPSELEGTLLEFVFLTNAVASIDNLSSILISFAKSWNILLKKLKNGLFFPHLKEQKTQLNKNSNFD